MSARIRAFFYVRKLFNSRKFHLKNTIWMKGGIGILSKFVEYSIILWTDNLIRYWCVERGCTT